MKLRRNLQVWDTHLRNTHMSQRAFCVYAHCKPDKWLVSIETRMLVLRRETVDIGGL